jgi:two-component system OmpR family sensor kinase
MRSLSSRLLLASVFAAVIALLVADIATYLSLRHVLYRQVDQTLRTTGLPSRDAPSGPPAQRRLAANIALEERDATGRVTNQIPALDGQGRPLTPRLPTRIATRPGSGLPDGPATFINVADTTGTVRFRAKAGTFPDGRMLILAMTLTDVESTLRRTLLVQSLVTAIVIAIAAFIGRQGITSSLRPLHSVRDTALAIANGDRSRRVETRGAEELAALATAFNTMVGELDDSLQERDEMVAQLRRFVADASHELRTPLAAVSAYAELFELGAADRPEDLRRSLVGINRETTRMATLVEDLLLLADLDGLSAPRRGGVQPIDLVPIAAHAVDSAGVVGPAWPVDFEADDRVMCLADPSELRRVLDNLLANVRAHTPPGTPARLEVRNQGQHVVVTVSDEGPGIDPSHQAHVFDRFWRADASRTRTSGGSGLGLAIVKAIIERHHGTVSVGAHPTGGTLFTIQLPTITGTREASPATRRPD